MFLSKDNIDEHQSCQRQITVVMWPFHQVNMNSCIIDSMLNLRLSKKVDPDEKRERYLETALKTCYSKVYEDIIKNDYILTHPERTQNVLDSLPNCDYETKKQANLRMHKQLNVVVSGKQKQSFQSYKALCSRFTDGITINSSVSPEKGQLLHAHLSKYVHQIPLYLQRQIDSKSMQYEHQPRKMSTTIKESQLIKRKSKKLWSKKQVAKRKCIIPLESLLGIASSKEEVAKSSQEVEIRKWGFWCNLLLLDHFCGTPTQ